MATQEGTLLIEVQGAVRSLHFNSDQERDEFLAYVGATLPEAWRVKLLTWRAGRSTQADVEAAQRLDKERRGAV